MAGSEEAFERRSTAPQSPYTLREVGIGLLVLLVGLLLVIVIPISFI